jgi:hypothetical protein
VVAPVRRTDRSGSLGIGQNLQCAPQILDLDPNIPH